MAGESSQRSGALASVSPLVYVPGHRLQSPVNAADSPIGRIPPDELTGLRGASSLQLGSLGNVMPRSEKEAAFEGVKCADLVDAMGRLHRHRCHILDLVSPTQGRVLFGPAVTISFFPSCSAALDPGAIQPRRPLLRGGRRQPGGEGAGSRQQRVHRRVHGRGDEARQAAGARVGGVLTDGRLRDFDELAGYDFAAYCSGEATHWGGDHVTPFQANVPVVLDRVGVVPGQYVYADPSGAVVIPEGQLEEVLAKARAIAADDRALPRRYGSRGARRTP